MSASEKAADAATREAIQAALHAGLIPVQPLIDMIVQYTLQFRSVVSTVTTVTFGPQLSFVVGISAYYSGTGSRELSFLVADMTGCGFFQLFPTDGRVERLAGLQSTFGFKNGPAAESEFFSPVAIRVDPMNPKRIYLADASSIRVLDRTNGSGVVSPIAGTGERDFVDGAGSIARFSTITDFVCTSDGSTLIVCDMYYHCLRSVDLKTSQVTTIAGDGNAINRNGYGPKAGLACPDSLSFDRTTRQPETALYVSCTYAIARFDRSTGEVREVAKLPFQPRGVVALPNGCVLCAVTVTHSLHVIDPYTGQSEVVAGGDEERYCGRKDGSALSEARFHTPRGICVIDSEQCVMVADMVNESIRRVTLSPHFFTHKPKK